MKPIWKSLGNGCYRITSEGWWCDVEWKPIAGTNRVIAGNRPEPLTDDEIAVILDS
jgi:hypothetical protein